MPLIFTVTGVSIRCTLDSSIKISFALLHTLRTWSSVRNSPLRSVSIKLKGLNISSMNLRFLLIDLTHLFECLKQQGGPLAHSILNYDEPDSKIFYP